MVSSAGSEAASALDADQRAVVDLPHDARGIVVGAPGAGKTTTLVARAAALVAQGVDPDSVLVLTPSRQTATDLRDRLSLAFGKATAGAPARSLASFAFQVVRAWTVTAGAEPPLLLTGGDEDQILQDMLDGDAEDAAAGVDRWPAWLGAEIRATRGFRTEVRTFLAECTTLGIEPSALRALGERHALPVWESLASFAAEYRQVRAGMRAAHRDAAGLVREAVGIVRAAGPGSAVIERISAVLVDDAQELTLGGVELIEALLARGIPVLAFGDPDVGSGAFRGVSAANFARLAGALGDRRILRSAHRGGASQVDLTARITQRIGAGGVVEHRRIPGEADDDGSVRALVTRSSAEEYDVIARLLRETHIHDGVPWGRCAVIAHDSRQVAALVAELAAREVPTRSSGPGHVLGTLAPVRDLLRLLEFAARDDELDYDDVVDALLSTSGRLDPIELRRLRSTLRHVELSAGGERSGKELLVSAMRTPLEFDLVDMREARRAATLARTVAELREQLARGATAHELLWTAWERSGLERAWAELARGTGPRAQQAGRDLDAVVSLFQAAKRFVERSLDADPRVFVRSILDSDVAEDRLDAPLRGETVSVLTPAGSLGLEFDTVVVAGVQDGVWPNTRLRGGLLETWRLADAATRPDGESAGVLDRRRTAMHDELRLLARAVTRASRRVVVTAVDDDDTGPSPFFELLPEAERATVAHPLSLRGLVAQHRRSLTDPAVPAPRRAHAAGQLAVLADAAVAGAAPADWFGVAGPSSTGPLRDLAREDVRVSPSRLHSLEECELNWVIGDLGGDPGGTTAGLGTIVHAALEHAKSSDEASLWAEVESRWDELTFEADWRGRAELVRARDLVRRLHLYLRRFEDSGGRLIGAEPHFEVAIPLEGAEAFEHGVLLSGYIDRVELTPEGAVVIIDLKTGKREPQTDAKVADNPQLAAYQLAFESGAIPTAEGHTAGGAKLLVLRPTAAKSDYVTPWQPPFDDERREAFLARVRSAVSVMRGTAFLAPYEEHCRDEFSYGLCRIHTIGSVSAS
ncbi:superfamily I DNA/RNA helicase/RecB family exonuclease [Microbacterium terrae]|uniref:DNA 3'-5' helicase n=1 Tax=Microbacterium terrae TaxID=69369 RepID=A0A0M2HB90_9MICO|nr:UrvD/REP family ATP-dependent DNA helicase [Microbacterium terrae]KJL43722.1 ATP-dependent DNA helicase UvrD1 [Microbacterium terrae]KJL43743.1 ATP-dependent DNA helicase UvrD1 [Microbacterium terrae]MBP1076990.1 superfamily I DNA/RNA helicase/RecB family exonuclease [Microbacterium terrae]